MQIFAVGVGKNVGEDELLNIVSGNSQRLFMVHDFNYLFNFLAEVLRGACEGKHNSFISSPPPLNSFGQTKILSKGGDLFLETENNLGMEWHAALLKTLLMAVNFVTF